MIDLCIYHSDPTRIGRTVRTALRESGITIAPELDGLVERYAEDGAVFAILSADSSDFRSLCVGFTIEFISRHYPARPNPHAPDPTPILLLRDKHIAVYAVRRVEPVDDADRTAELRAIRGLAVRQRTAQQGILILAAAQDSITTQFP